VEWVTVILLKLQSLRTQKAGRGRKNELSGEMLQGTERKLLKKQGRDARLG